VNTVIYRLRRQPATIIIIITADSSGPQPSTQSTVKQSYFTLESMPTVLLYGLGAIGGFYAFILSRNKDVELDVVARSNYDAVKQNGLKIHSENHGEHVVRPRNGS
jgi:hypothetical protein